MRVLLNDADCRRYLQTAGVTELTAADLSGSVERQCVGTAPPTADNRRTAC